MDGGGRSSPALRREDYVGEEDHELTHASLFHLLWRDGGREVGGGREASSRIRNANREVVKEW